MRAEVLPHPGPHFALQRPKDLLQGALQVILTFFGAKKEAKKHPP
jgi:hypothetical protein